MNTYDRRRMKYNILHFVVKLPKRSARLAVAYQNNTHEHNVTHRIVYCFRIIYVHTYSSITHNYNVRSYV